MRLPVLAFALVMLTTPALAQERLLAVFDEADVNHDGKITRPEFAAARERNFDKMDRNGDGVVSRDDFGMLLSFAPARGKRLDAFIAAADADNDKRMTRGELRGSPMRMFDRADGNKDDIVDAAELKSLRAVLQAE